jgi:hypothetical protein
LHKRRVSSRTAVGIACCQCINYSIVPLIRKLVIRTSNYPDWLGSSDKFIENSTKLSCPEITGYRIKCSTVLRLIELQIRRGRKVQTQVRTANSNSRISDCHCSRFSKKNSIIRIFCISGWLAIPNSADNWSSAVYPYETERYSGPCLLIWNIMKEIYRTDTTSERFGASVCRREQCLLVLLSTDDFV